jgi:DNA modification methylase
MTFEVLHCPDSFDFLHGSGEKVFDVVITDPPYPEHVQENMRSGSIKKGIPKYELDFSPLTTSQHVWLKDALRLTRRWVISFCVLESFGRFQDLLGKEYVRGCVWCKPNSMGQLTADRPAAAYEGITCAHPLTTKKRWNGKGSYGIWSANGTRGKKGRHPNEKPINLCLKLVSLFSERGETIFDPFCGSAAIGEAALLLGRNYIGLDQNTEWVDKANERLKNIEFGKMSDEYALGLCRLWGNVEEAP